MRQLRSLRRLLVPLVLAPAPLIAQAARAAPQARAAPATASVLLIEAMDFAFRLPPTAPAGLVTVRVKNTGKSLHHVQLTRLGAGQTLASFMNDLRRPGSPSWREGEGGPSWALGGQTAEVQLLLAPGTYAVWCWIPASDGQAHFMRGMFSKLEVVGTSSVKSASMSGDIDVKVSDYDFALSKPLTSGMHTFRVENRGPQAHEFAVVRLNDGKTALDVLTWLERGQNGAAPGRLVGGTTSLAPGRVVALTLGITPGEYAILCFTPEHLKGTGKPHADMGMMKTFTVP